MSGVLVELALSNLLASAALAGAAWAVHRHGRYPGLAHLLWVFVLAKLLTPPLLTLPLIRTASEPALAVANPAAATSSFPWAIDQLVTLILLAWAFGSMVVLVISMRRIGRFDSLLRRTSMRAPADVQTLAADAGRRLGLRSVPTIYQTSARLSPMTWWVGQRVWVILPVGLPERLSADQLRWVLAHELAHVKRRDHVVRWLEWLACVAFWWNPVAWWARRNLHVDEEASCDALVIERLGSQPRAYAGALLAVVESLARPTPPPAVATGIDGGGSLERRFHRILSGDQVTRAPRLVAIATVAAAVLLMPVGLGSADDAAQGTPPTTADIAAGPEPEPAEAITYGLTSAELSGPADTGLAANRATRKLKAAEKALAKAERALGKVEQTPKRAANAVADAQMAVKQARRAVRQLEAPPAGMGGTLRDVNRSLREATRRLEAAQAE